MNTDDLTQSVYKLLSGIDSAAKEMEPHIQNMRRELQKKQSEFALQKEQINKDIDRGGRTTQHRLHL